MHSAEDEHEHAAGSDFVSFLAAESPEAHVQHVYEESGASSGFFSWMIDATRCVAFERFGMGPGMCLPGTMDRCVPRAPLSNVS